MNAPSSESNEPLAAPPPVQVSDPAPPAPTATAPAPAPRLPGLAWLLLVALTAAMLLTGGFAWNTQSRVRELEAELVKRQQGSAEVAAEARIAARQAQEAAREAQAKLGLLEARVAESSLQRSQIEELMVSVSRSRDENIVADLEAALRLAMQHSAVTSSAEPLVGALRQAEERLTRLNQPQLERVRRAVQADLERVKAAAVGDLSSLALRLDEAIRMVDELPMLARPVPPARGAARSPSATAAVPTASPAPPQQAASTASAAEAEEPAWRRFGAQLWTEVRSLVRVTPIDRPEAMLVAPDQAYFLRENLKLRLLNARLALLSRQFDTAQSDLRDARSVLDRYFDRSARPVQSAQELVRQVAAQARLVQVPRPDATLAALAAAAR